jgi:ribonuclease HII
MLNFERVLWRAGVQHIAGVDEVGMGPLAGPVIAAAVVFPPHTELHGIDDSKRLDVEQRVDAARRIREAASGIGIGRAEVAEIDSINIYHAGLLAMRRAVEALPMRPQHVLVDARSIPGVDVPQNCFDKGDGLDFSIAAASIVAKVHRDGLMDELAREHPDYGFDRHKGYCTPEHQDAIRRLGPCAIHRQSFTTRPPPRPSCKRSTRSSAPTARRSPIASSASSGSCYHGAGERFSARCQDT